MNSLVSFADFFAKISVVMGLADIRTVTLTMTTVNHHHHRSAGSGGTAGAGNATTVVPMSQVRKKRTFDIAFLTGQEEREEKSSSSPSLNNNVTSGRKSPMHRRHHLHSSTPPIMDESTSNSTSSSIDVMTNGSLSESELNLSPCHHLHGRRSTTVTPTEAVITPSSLSSSCSPPGGSPPLNAGTLFQMQRHGRANTTTSQEHGQKSRKNKHREEIRFESKRTIDINQTPDSLKIKENLQFSSTLPTSSLPSGVTTHVAAAMAPVLPVGSSVAAELVKSLPFALLPSIANFPGGVHLPSPFATQAKIDKAESSSLSYPGISSGGASPAAAAVTKMSRNSPAGTAGPPASHVFPDPYNLQIGPTGYPYPPNLMLPHDLNRSPNYPSPGHPIIVATSQAAGGHHHNHHPHHHHHHHQHHPHGQGSPPQAISAAAAAVAAAATLLPPSLTALTLPAQNVCAKCNIGFRMTSDLVYHMRSHHKRDSDPMKKKREEKLKCPVCHESFRERHHLTRHMTAHQDRAEEGNESEEKKAPKI